MMVNVRVWAIALGLAVSCTALVGCGTNPADESDTGEESTVDAGAEDALSEDTTSEDTSSDDASSEDGTSGRCSGPDAGSEEVCDGKDNDCDGEVDEGADQRCADSGEPGRCKPGIRTCQSDGTLSECQPMLRPVPEVCNGLDDDCDGLIDNTAESWDNLGSDVTTMDLSMSAKERICAQGEACGCEPDAADTEHRAPSDAGSGSLDREFDYVAENTESMCECME